jgi:hypothetical protein
MIGAKSFVNIHFSVSTVITFHLCSVKVCDQILVLWKVKTSEDIMYRFFQEVFRKILKIIYTCLFVQTV